MLTSWPRSTITRATAFVALILIPSLSSAAIYKCTAPEGSITYTDAPCPADTATQYIDPAAPSWLYESSQNMSTTAALLDAKNESQPEILAILCANDEFKFWLKAQRHGLPDRDVPNSEIDPIQLPLPKGSPPPGSSDADSANAAEGRSWARDAVRSLTPFGPVAASREGPLELLSC